MILLSTPRLRVEITEPGQRPNDTCRFDRAGYISDVTLDGMVHFCSSEPRNLWHPCTGGRGLCCEFLADYSREVLPGAYFPKFGVGLFPRGDEPHIFYRRYENMQEFPVHVTASENQVFFETEAIPCRGIALKLKKTVSVHDNVLTMETEACNSGERPVSTREYCHNFLCINGMSLGPDYSIELPDLGDFGTDTQIDIYGNPCNWCGDGHGFTLSRSSAEVAYIHVDLSSLHETEYFTWIIRHKGDGAWVEGHDYFRPDGMD
ncbi:MAG: hypothetical protein LIO86_03910, partial [Lachnospiraceae bacterium]|nr:hypothetical protein [Lachnospiraceae bacterium]